MAGSVSTMLVPGHPSIHPSFIIHGVSGRLAAMIAANAWLCVRPAHLFDPNALGDSVHLMNTMSWLRGANQSPLTPFQIAHHLWQRILHSFRDWNWAERWIRVLRQGHQPRGKVDRI